MTTTRPHLLSGAILAVVATSISAGVVPVGEHGARRAPSAAADPRGGGGRTGPLHAPARGVFGVSSVFDAVPRTAVGRRQARGGGGVPGDDAPGGPMEWTVEVAADGTGGNRRLGDRNGLSRRAADPDAGTVGIAGAGKSGSGAVNGRDLIVNSTDHTRAVGDDCEDDPCDRPAATIIVISHGTPAAATAEPTVEVSFANPHAMGGQCVRIRSRREGAHDKSRRGAKEKGDFRVSA